MAIVCRAFFYQFGEFVDSLYYFGVYYNQLVNPPATPALRRCMMTTLSARDHSKAIGVFPATKCPRYTKNWDMVTYRVYLYKHQPLDLAAYAMEYVIKTGRMSIFLTRKLEQMTPYQVMKLLIKMSEYPSIMLAYSWLLEEMAGNN